MAEFLASRDWTLPAFIALSLAVLIWNVALAGQVTQFGRAPREYLALTALAGLLVAPAAMVAVTSSTILLGRAMHALEWLWPTTLVLCAAQATYALTRRLARPLLALPIALYDIFLAGATIARYATQFSPDLPPAVVGIDAAHSSSLGFLIGREALYSPLAIGLPILLPARAARGRANRWFRGALATAAAAAAWLMVAEYPGAVVAARSFATFALEPLQERPRGDFQIGVRIFPTLGGPPPTLAIRNDLALVDTLDLDAVSVVLSPGGTSALALDSLNVSLEATRRDSTLLFVALAYDADDRRTLQRSPRAYRDERIAMVDRVMRRLRPDVILPAHDPYDAGRRALGDVPVSWWREYLTESARLVQELRPRTRVAVSVSTFSAGDSALYAWASDARSPIELTGFSFRPSYHGGLSLATRFHVAERWIRANRKPHWVFAASGYPRTFGERSQEQAIWGTLAWATSQARVLGAIVEGAGDYDALNGLRASGGRLRPATFAVDRARRALAEAAATGF
jgi:hypothetical protein